MTSSIRNLRSNPRNPAKIIILLTLLTFITSASSIVLTSFPQHLWISNTTKFGDYIQFEDNNIAIIKGNQVSYIANQVIPLSGRGYVRITANQVQFGGSTYQEGIRTVFAEWNQNLLLQQEIGKFSTSRVAQVGVGTTVINLIPISTDVVNINVVDLTGKIAQTNYNLQFVQNTAYISENGVMLELSKKDGSISITLIGSGYKNVWMRVI